MTIQAISLHPKLGAALELIISALIVWWLSAVVSLPVLGLLALARFLAGLGLVSMVYYPADFSRWRHLGTLALFWYGTMALLFFIDWPLAWYVVAALAVLIPAASFFFSAAARGAALVYG